MDDDLADVIALFKAAMKQHEADIRDLQSLVRILSGKIQKQNALIESLCEDARPV